MLQTCHVTWHPIWQCVNTTNQYIFVFLAWSQINPSLKSHLVFLIIFWCKWGFGCVHSTLITLTPHWPYWQLHLCICCKHCCVKWIKKGSSLLTFFLMLFFKRHDYYAFHLIAGDMGRTGAAACGIDTMPSNWMLCPLRAYQFTLQIHPDVGKVSYKLRHQHHITWSAHHTTMMVSSWLVNSSLSGKLDHENLLKMDPSYHIQLLWQY